MNKKIGALIGIILVLILIVVLVIAFISNNSKKITMQDVITKFKEAGITVTLEDKPYFSMVGAKDGEMFYLENSPVKLYEYKDESSYKQALKDYAILKNMPCKGLVVIDTNSGKALEIFNTL